MLAYLCVINNRADELRLQRIINNPPRGIGGKTLEMAERQAAAAGVPLYTVVSDPYSYPSLEKAAAKLMAFTVMIEECAELLQTLPLPDFYEEVMIAHRLSADARGEGRRGIAHPRGERPRAQIQHPQLHGKHRRRPRWPAFWRRSPSIRTLSSTTRTRTPSS